MLVRTVICPVLKYMVCLDFGPTTDVCSCILCTHFIMIWIFINTLFCAVSKIHRSPNKRA
uniref:Uncharacterized protein n=1 Tax=Arundo donax TaxID=35708 RepID=A0A0A9GDZ0_ARUDO